MLKKLIFWLNLFSIPLVIYFIFIAWTFPYLFIKVDIYSDGKVIVQDIDNNNINTKIEIKPGDEILTINGEIASNHSTIKKFKIVEQVYNIEFISEGKYFFKEITFSYNFKEFFSYVCSPILVFLFCLILNFFLYPKAEKKTDFLFSALLILIGIGYAAAGASARGDLLAKLITNTSFILSPVILSELLFSIFRYIKISKIWQYILKSFYFFAFSLILLSNIGIMFDWLIPIFKNVNLYYFIGIAFFVISIIYKAYNSQKNNEISTRIKILSFGISMAFFPFITLYAFPISFFNVIPINPETTTLSIIFLPLTILYLIYQDIIIDIDFILSWFKKDLLYAIVASILFYFFSSYETIEETIINSFYVFIICLAVLLIKNPIYFRASSLFRSKSVNLDERLNRFFLRLEKESSPSELMNILKDEVRRVIPEIPIVRSFELEDSSRLMEVQHFLNASPEQMNELPQAQLGKIIPLNQGFCVLLHKKERRLLFLYCSNKNNRTELNPVERAWIETLAHYSNVLLSNQYSIESVIHELHLLKENDGYYSQWLSNFLFNFTERERVRLAGDLHDSVLQDLLFIHMKLQKVKEPLSPSIERQVDVICELVLDCAHTTREACNRLSPPFLLQYGLLVTLQELIKKVHLQANYRVELDTVNLKVESLHEEHTIALFRIIQELFSNATKHSEATVVTLRLAHVQEAVILEYADNGVGFSIDHFKKDYANFNGLINMQERVKSLSGEIDFSSNKGFQVTIQLPLRFTHPAFVNSQNISQVVN